MTTNKKSAKTEIVVLIPCAGGGSRFGSNMPKQYTKIGDKTILEHTLQAFLAVKLITKIVLVVSKNDEHFLSLLDKSILSNIDILTCGGNTRAKTVLNGLNSLNLDANSWILVHDAARCCITPELINKQISTLFDDLVGGILAIPAKDTIKIVKNNIIEQTLDRQTIYLAQTPQMFRYNILTQALRDSDISNITDEASAVEKLGLSVRIILGSPTNIKITYREDLAIATTIIGGTL
ncbi:MAG: 2-C-methyl-D-erythritol 4-phosphate cytidylyltransferase [Proteobacteria bacterium]|jgi:2-C-methyl-D-erythritol 4-phosphate cytidylyltransferase|nr:2-C-methyl-D-erythritol 4-phosphate cytidylyltransferase [Pseudomonadota bacterium]